MEKEDNSPTKSKPPSIVNTDEEDLLTTSTDSSLCDTWTVVNSKNYNAEPNEILEEVTLSENEQITDREQKEVAKVLIEEGVEQLDPKTEEEDDTKSEISDGISIISEAESTGLFAGRISPHPYLRDHLDNFQLRFPSERTPTPEDFAPVRNQLRYRRRNSPPTSIVEEFRKKEQLRNKEIANISNSDQCIPDGFKSILTAVIYLSVALVLVSCALCAKYPSWNPIETDKSLELLEERVTQLEVENKFMRAEFDIVSKEIAALFQKNGDSQFLERKLERTKQFKAWQGIGESLDSVDIEKSNLKRAFKCADGGFVEVAVMCVENKSVVEPFLDKVSNVVNSFFPQSAEQLQQFEKVTEQSTKYSEHICDEGSEVKKPKENPYRTRETESSRDSTAEPARNRRGEDGRINEQRKWDKHQQNVNNKSVKNFNNKQKNNSAEKYDNSNEKKFNKHKQHRSKEYDNDDSDEVDDNEYRTSINKQKQESKYEKNNNNFQKQPNNFKERHNSDERKNSKERFSSDERRNSKERHNFVEHQNSKERHNSDEQRNSKERRNYNKRQNSNENRSSLKERRNFDERKNSRERYDSRERSNADERLNSSKERHSSYERSNSEHFNSKEHFHDNHKKKDDMWLWEMMHQRDMARRRPKENWFLKRADSREQMRHS